MREEYDRTRSTQRAVVEGLGRTGRLVTSAALILSVHARPKLPLARWGWHHWPAGR